MLSELKKMIKKSRRRLSESPYRIQDVFRPADYDWPGDWEGRALLAFTCHTQIGEEFPAQKEELSVLSEKLGEKGYLGASFNEKAIDEQQLAGHNWMLRGLIESGKTGDTAAPTMARRLVGNLYLPALKYYGSYPVLKREENGGVSGRSEKVVQNWLLSTDVGCAFVPLDGIAEYYKFTRDERIKPLLEGAIERFSTLNFMGLKMQMHATLSALRGILTFYEATGDKKYLELVRKIFELYIREGMTLTYENYNWFARKDSWTEPCAVVDSFILAVRLFRITGEGAYRTLARRIGFNGLRFCQRENGGAGPNTCVTETQPYLKVFLYEAEFCCTMRYGEGLKWLWQNRDLFDEEEETVRFENGRYFCGDRLLVEDSEGIFTDVKVFEKDGRRLIFIPSLTETDRATAEKVRLRVYFGE